MNGQRDTCSAEEQTGERRHHLPEAAELSVAGEQGGGVTETARSLRRIGGDPGDSAESALRHIAQCGKPAGDGSHMRWLAFRNRNIRDRHRLPRPSLLRAFRGTGSGSRADSGAVDKALRARAFN